jgi:cell division protein FtsX
VDGAAEVGLNDSVRAVGLRVRGALRRRWASVCVVALIVAVVAGTVLTLAAGARRTASAPDAFTAAVGGDVDADLQQPSGRPRTEEIAALPGVESVDAMTFAFAGVVDPKRGAAQDTISFIGSRLASRLVAGRAAHSDNPHEFVADRSFVRQHDAHVGDRYKVISWTQAQADHGLGFGPEPNGPSFTATLVGVVQTPSSLEDAFSIAVFSPALLKQDVGIVATLMSVRLEPGVTRAQLRAAIDRLPDGRAISVARGRVVSAEVRNGVEAVSRGIWIMALVAAVAAVVALGQLLGRHARVVEVERQPLDALGYSSRQLGAETVLRAAVPAVVGIVIGAGGAVLTSGLFPTGFVRAIEPDPGIRVDAGALAVGAILLLAGLLAWVAAAFLSAGRVEARRSRSRSRSSDAIARGAPSPAAATGTNFALTSREGSTTTAFGTVVAMALIVAGLVGAAAFAVSLNRLVRDRDRFGSNYTFAVGDNSDLSASDLRKGLEGARDIDGLMILTAADARAGGTTVPITGFDRIHGDLAPRVLRGRLPESPDEAALGSVTAGDLDLHVGDEFALAGSAGRATMRVVGIAVLPTIGGNDGVGKGALLTEAGFTNLEPHPDTTMAAITLAQGAPPNAARVIAKRVGQSPGQEDRPGAIINVARVRNIPAVLAGLLAVLALLTIVHSLIVSIQSRRRDVAVLRAFGADRRWIARTVHWQATVLTVLPLVFGIPIGVVAGSFVFRAFVARIGARPDPAIPLLLLFAMAVVLVAVANLAAIVPARRARRLSTAELLQAE